MISPSARAKVSAPGAPRRLMLAHDIPLDLIVTLDRTIACPRHHERPTGILWCALLEEKIAEIPVLARLARAGRR
jgi:hypothetical protein